MANQRSRRGQADKKPLRRRPGEGTFCETKTGFRFRCVVGETATGKNIFKDFYGRDKAEAVTKSEAYRRANPSGPPSSDEQQTLGSFLLTWLQHEVEPNNAVSTFESYTSTIANHINPTIGKVALCDLRTLQIQAWVNELAKIGDKGKGRTAAYAFSILRAALNTAVRWDILDENPADGVSVPRYTKRKGRALTLPQVRALIQAAAGAIDVRKPIKRSNGRMMPPIKVNTRFACLYLLYVALGTRRGELLALRWSDIDLEVGTVKIERSLDKHRRERETKTETSNRLLYLNPSLIDALLVHREQMRREQHDEGFNPDGIVFPTEDGTTINPSNLRRHFKTVLRAAGLPDSIRIHDLRHTAASLMLARSNQLTDVSKTLGHSSTTVTGQIYAHSYEEGIRKAIASVSDAIGGE